MSNWKLYAGILAIIAGMFYVWAALTAEVGRWDEVFFAVVWFIVGGLWIAQSRRVERAE